MEPSNLECKVQDIVGFRTLAGSLDAPLSHEVTPKRGKRHPEKLCAIISLLPTHVSISWTTKHFPVQDCRLI